MTQSTLKESKLHDITHFGIRLAVGSIFLYHSVGKFNPGFQGFLTRLGLPVEMQIPIALAESVCGTLSIMGVLSRISGSILSIISLGAIFVVKGLDKFSGGQSTGWEFDVMLLAGALLTTASGPGRVSISHIIKKIPRVLQ